MLRRYKRAEARSFSGYAFCTWLSSPVRSPIHRVFYYSTEFTSRGESSEIVLKKFFTYREPKEIRTGRYSFEH